MEWGLIPFQAEHIESTYRWLEDADLRAQIDSIGEPTVAGNKQYWDRRLDDPKRPDLCDHSRRRPRR